MDSTVSFHSPSVREQFKLARRWQREVAKAPLGSRLSGQWMEVNSLLRDITGRWETNFRPSNEFGMASEKQWEYNRETGRSTLKGPWLNFKRFCEFEKTGIKPTW